MKDAYDELIHKELQKLTEGSLPPLSAFPDLPLYMDQVTSLLERWVEHSKRYDDDKVLTKTMINNYTKSGILPPPSKKRYQKEHLYLLLSVYYLKNFLTMEDILTLTDPLRRLFDDPKDREVFADLYESLQKEGGTYKAKLKKDLTEEWDKVREEAEASSIEAKGLILTRYLLGIAYDVFLKAHFLQNIADEIKAASSDKKVKRKKDQSHESNNE